MNDPLVIDDAHTIPANELVYETMHASGPGGQHVNTADTRVRIRYALTESTVLPEAVKVRIRRQRPGLMTTAGELIVSSGRYRSQRRNAEDVRERLRAIVQRAFEPPRPRRPTRPTSSSKARRLAVKKQRGQLKVTRGRVHHPCDE